MTDFARLVLDADTRGLKNAERDLKNVDRQAGQTAKDVDTASGRMSSAFKKVGVALVAAGITNVLFDFGKKSVQAAIDAEEMGSAFNVVFGDMADSVRDWAEVTGDALGRSTQEIMRGALAFQELFGKSLDPAAAAEMSKQFAVLTQDLASFKNLSNEVAQQKLFSGLVGEAEPLRAVGVFLNEAAVQAKAAELGLAGVNGVLTDQEKIVARAALIQEQLSNAQGDVIRTSDSAANQIKTMNAAVEELQVAIGQKLLPQLTPLITLTGELIGMMAAAAQQFNVTTSSTANFVEGLRVMGRWVQRGAQAFQSLGNWLGWADEQMRKAARRAAAVAGPIAQVVSLIERLGARSRSQQSVDSILNGSLSTDFIAGELAVMGKGITAINAPAALPAVSANIDKVSASGRAAGASLKAVNDNLASIAASPALSILDEFNNSAANARLAAIGGGPIDEMAELEKAANRYVKTLEETKGESQTQTIAIADTFAQMSQRITSSLQGLANSIQSGNFLGILGGVLDIFTQLGSVGVFGSGIQSNLNRSVAGARANGGSVASGSTYLVGERGPELFTPHGHGRIVSNDNMGGSTHITVGIDPASGNVLAFVDGRIAATGPVIANAGAMQAQAMGARSARRRVR